MFFICLLLAVVQNTLGQTRFDQPYNGTEAEWVFCTQDPFRNESEIEQKLWVEKSFYESALLDMQVNQRLSNSSEWGEEGSATGGEVPLTDGITIIMLFILLYAFVKKRRLLKTLP